MKQYDDILNDAIIKNGADKQIKMVSEEVGELLQSLNKIDRSNMISRNVILRPGEHGLNTKQCQLFYGLCSEIADVKLLIRQLELMVGPLGQEAISISLDRRSERLKERLNKNTY